MDNDVTGAQKAVGDAFQWRVLALEQARNDHELRLREVERGMATMNERAVGMDRKLDDVLAAVRDNQQKVDEAPRKRLDAYTSVIVALIVVVVGALIEHFWK